MESTKLMENEKKINREAPCTVVQKEPIEIRVSNRNSVAHYVAERNAIFTVISARFVAHIPLPLAPNLRLKVSFLAY